MSKLRKFLIYVVFYVAHFEGRKLDSSVSTVAESGLDDRGIWFLFLAREANFPVSMMVNTSLVPTQPQIQLALLGRRGTGYGAGV
jgi:hypothetical protein